MTLTLIRSSEITSSKPEEPVESSLFSGMLYRSMMLVQEVKAQIASLNHANHALRVVCVAG